MARFFIDRPIFAIVLSLIIMLAGGIAVFGLPVEQFPPVAPPTINISASYSGASAVTMENIVVQQIEQQMSGLDHLLYMSSNSDDAGNSTTTLTFASGTNPDIAQVQVQNKLALAMPKLPTAVQQSGLRVTKASSSILMVIGFYSADNSMSKFDIADYITSNVFDPISRVDGVGDLSVYGTQYAMRIWLDSNKLNNYSLTPLDVNAALQQQNVQISGGQLGGTPALPNQTMSATITESTLLSTPEQFGKILLKVMPDGSQVRLRDVARINLGGENFSVDAAYNRRPASGLQIQLAPGANALKTAEAVRKRISELQPYFPHGLVVTYPNDTTPFIKISIREVVKTLIEGIILVFLVMYLFLQNFRATLIPSITVPVVLLGTFGVMAALNFSINTLTMFGLVLAIGLLVDDAIVVVENVERVMHEDGLGPLEATRKAMGQISGALIGVAMVLCAVFVPVAFSSGTVGAIYRQFSLTVVSAMVLSVFVALTLTPALCATLLKPADPDHHEKKGFFGWFNRGFDRSRDRYLGGVRHILGRRALWLIVYAVVIAAVVLLFTRIPTSFLPNEDQGYIFVQVQTPPGSSQNITNTAVDDVSAYLLKDESAMVDATFMLNGVSFSGRGQNQARIFVHLRDWEERKAANLSVTALSARISKHFASYKGAAILPIDPPAIQGLGTAAGFDFELQDRGGLGREALNQARDQLIEMARKDPDLAQVRFTGQADNPTFKLNIDRERAAALGLAISDIDQTFSVAWGSTFVNYFLDTDNRVKRVYTQADAQFRMNPGDLDKLYVRSKTGDMVPFSAFSSTEWSFGTPVTQRYNGVEAVEIQGKSAPGKTSGDAMLAMQRLAAKLPQGIGYEWTGVSLQQQQSGSQAPFLYALSIIVVFLSLAALYESWSIPVSVIMVVPIGVLGALAAAASFGMANDLYFQVGLLTTIGLSAKNAILIVEFARDLTKEGMGALEAAVEAAKMRMRPIVMTSMAFVLGVLPLALANGAGAASQKAIGIGVIGGMLTATFFATFMIPMFFVLISDKIGKAKKHPAAAAAAPGAIEPEAGVH
ncbi:MAG TPA: efflux RND transporter permease subunit [Janthinobacterium sp.]|nr:efflux RND transporter permease subunit [Janthinobacterium sp.]